MANRKFFRQFNCQYHRALIFYLHNMFSTAEPLPVPPNSLSFDQVRLHFVQIIPGDASRGFVPYYHFRILVADGTDVGHINFRVGETEHVRLCAGTSALKLPGRSAVMVLRCRRAARSLRLSVHSMNRSPSQVIQTILRPSGRLNGWVRTLWTRLLSRHKIRNISVVRAARNDTNGRLE
jgi:hypothetical protein